VGSLKTYLEQVKVKGTASDIVREANSLKTRSNELVNVEAKLLKKSVDALGSMEVTFHQLETMLNAGSNIGKITTRITKPSKSLFVLHIAASVPAMGSVFMYRRYVCMYVGYILSERCSGQSVSCPAFFLASNLIERSVPIL